VKIMAITIWTRTAQTLSNPQGKPMIRYKGKTPIVTPKGMAVLIGLQALLKAVNKPKRKKAKR